MPQLYDLVKTLVLTVLGMLFSELRRPLLNCIEINGYCFCQFGAKLWISLVEEGGHFAANPDIFNYTQICGQIGD